MSIYFHVSFKHIDVVNSKMEWQFIPAHCVNCAKMHRECKVARSTILNIAMTATNCPNMNLKTDEKLESSSPVH